jgi:crossover junction endodeoxyribonuclease RusA
VTRIAVLTVPAPAEWLNSNHRRHRMVEAKLVKLWRQAGREAVEGMGWEPCSGAVHIMARFWKPRNGRYDPNNLWPTVKPIVDGLVDAGFLVDDDHLHVEGPDMRHGGVGQARVILTITRKDVP